jgi:hypothetical protein
VVKEGWNGFNVIHDAASRVAALDMGFSPSPAARARKSPPKVVGAGEGQAGMGGCGRQGLRPLGGC